ncbi:hypothetical protein Ancab_022688 [Ancistrocladus abbreviatus]
MNHKPIGVAPELTFGGRDMKRSPCELALEEIFREPIESCNATNDRNYNSTSNNIRIEKVQQRGGVFDDASGLFGIGDNNREGFSNLDFALRNRDIIHGFSASGGLAESPLWSQNFTPKQPSASATIDSQSSICASSPMSTHKPNSQDNQARGTTSGSSREQSDDDDAEIETGPCEQSTDPIDLKRIRRKFSNRESARRSRKRKEAHLADLELQVDQLSEENVTLCKQLTEADQQLRDATTNNRVLKSDVEALRAKVKLAEDMVTRGSLSCSLNHLLQSHLTSPQLLLNAQNLTQVPNATHTITNQGEDAPFSGMAFPDSIASNNIYTINNSNAKSGIGSDSVSGVSGIWPWGFQVSAISK